MTLDLSTPGIARLGSWSAKISPVRFAILKLLLESGDGMVTREVVGRQVYGRRTARSTNIVAVHMCHLRKTLKGSGFTIGNRWAKGWYLKPESNAQAST